MFEVAWMPFLAALSGPLQETDELDVVELCLDGLKSAIKIVCLSTSSSSATPSSRLSPSSRFSTT